MVAVAGAVGVVSLLIVPCGFEQLLAEAGVILSLHQTSLQGMIVIGCLS